MRSLEAGKKRVLNLCVYLTDHLNFLLFMFIVLLIIRVQVKMGIALHYREFHGASRGSGFIVQRLILEWLNDE